MKIRTHMMATVAVAIALMATVVACAWFAEQRITRAIALTEARNLALQLQVALTWRDPAGAAPLVRRPAELQQFIAEVHRRLGRDIVVINADKIDIGDVPEAQHDVGKRFEHDTDNEVGKTIADGLERTFAETSRDYPEGIESLVIPLAEEGADGFRGALVMEYTPLLEAAHHRMHDVLMVIGAAAGLSLAVAVTSALLLLRRFNAGMQALTGGIEALGSGQLDARVELRTRDEFGALALGFNDMAAQIESSRTQIDEQRLVQDIVDSAADGIALIDRKGAVVAVNPAAATIVGDSVARLLGRRWHEVTRLRDARGEPFEPGASPIETALAENRSLHLELAIERPNGVLVPVIVTCNPIAQVHGGMVVTLADISELRRAERAVVERATELAAANRELQQSSDATIQLVRLGELLQACVSFDECFSVVQTAMPAFFGAVSGSLHLTVASRNLVEEAAHWGGGHSSAAQFGPQDCWALRRGQEHRSGTGIATPRCRHVLADAAETSTCLPLAAQGETLGILHLCGGADEMASIGVGARAQILRGVADTIALAVANLRLRDALRQQSIRDPNTGLFNRRYLEETGLRELHRARRLNQPLAVLMLDIDHFKRFNDGFGHEAGDIVLKQVGVLLTDHCRESDIAARYGGEEFALVFPGTALEAGLERAQQLCKAVSEMHLSYRGLALGHVTASIGVVAYPSAGADFNDLLRAADRMLYRAKTEGRNRVVALSDPRVAARAT